MTNKFLLHNINHRKQFECTYITVLDNTILTMSNFSQTQLQYNQVYIYEQ